MTYKDFIDSISLVFTTEKVKKDLFEYLDLDIAEETIIMCEGKISADSKSIKFSAQDEITILEYNIPKRYCMLSFLPYRVVVIIGSYSVNENTGFLATEKCLAELYYNSYFEVITADFFH